MARRPSTRHQTPNTWAKKQAPSPTPPSPTAVNNPLISPGNRQQSILTIGSPIGATPTFPVAFGEFFKTCHYCKKRIQKDDDVFMYGVLLAFCNNECRERQMKLDRCRRNKHQGA